MGGCKFNMNSTAVLYVDLDQPTQSPSIHPSQEHSLSPPSILFKPVYCITEKGVVAASHHRYHAYPRSGKVFLDPVLPSSCALASPPSIPQPSLRPVNIKHR
ncbi:hypothetical protein VTJ04DRAFT_9206 [Mycothermus thermophilus]|uniref:uncharacterized protein n=1 Tax=Humicola insolens TaxID=85995 RepID=UPI0037446344